MVAWTPEDMHGQTVGRVELEEDMVTKSVNDARIRQLVEEGWQSKRISEELAAEGIHITPSGVRMWKSRNGLAGNSRGLVYTEAFPWPGMTSRHAQSYTAGMLRLDARLRRGEVIDDPDMLEQVASWRRARTRKNEVIWFGTDSGFIALDREPEDDPETFVRTPATMEEIIARLRGH